MLLLFFVRANTSCSIHVVVHTQKFFCCLCICKYVVLPPLFHTFHHVPLSDGCRICYLWQQNENKVLSLPHSSTLFCLVCHPAIIFVLFVVRRSFVLSFSLHIRPCSLLPLQPLFFACCCCFFCASPFSFCFPCFSLLFLRALCLFSVGFCFIVQQS